MKNSILLLSFLCCLVLVACEDQPKTDAPTNSTSVTKEEPKLSSEQKQQIEALMNPDPTISYDNCFRNIQAFANEENAKDIEELKLRFDGDNVTGIFNVIPAFKDARWGRIEGKQHMSQVDGKYIFVQEGKIDTAKIKIILRQDHVILYGEPVELGIGAEISVTDCNASTSE